jgi:hypothetical protein
MNNTLMNTTAMNTDNTLNLQSTKKENTMKNYPYDTDVISFEKFHEAIASFRDYQAGKSNHPKYDETYGTKLTGKLSHVHYAFFALLRGKSPEATTHDVKSDSYHRIKHQLKELTHVDRDYYGVQKKLVEAFGLSRLQIAHVIMSQDEIK